MVYDLKFYDFLKNSVVVRYMSKIKLCHILWMIAHFLDEEFSQLFLYLETLKIYILNAEINILELLK